MSDHEFEAYLALLSKLLRLSGQQREAISAELRDHLDHRLEELKAEGVSHDEAVVRALEEFGDAAGLAAELSHIRQYVRRRRIMKATLTTVSAAAAVILVTMALLPQRPGMEFNAEAVAQETMRGGGLVGARETPPSVEQLLERRIDVDFSDVELGHVFEYIRQVAEVNLLVQWPSLSRMNVASEDVVSMQLKQVTVRQTLEFVLRQVDAGQNMIEYTIVDDVIVVDIRRARTLNTEIRFYQCGRLMQRMPAVSLQYTHNGSFNTGSAMRDLAVIVMKQVEPESWGHGVGVEHFGDVLIVRHTPEVHKQIEALLQGLDQAFAESQKAAEARNASAQSEFTRPSRSAGGGGFGVASSALDMGGAGSFGGGEAGAERRTE